MAKKKPKSESAEADVCQTTVEDAMEELVQIVALLESGQSPLDESLKKFERGMVLLRHCHNILDAAAGKIELVTRLDAEGAVQTTEFDGTASISRSERSDDDSGSLF